MVKAILKKLIPIVSYDDGFVRRDYAKILGVHILIRVEVRKGYVEKKINESIQVALNRACDIEKAPRARGKLRALQLADKKLLDIFDLICKHFGFTYFIGSGTLMGALRHRGFIPWDDDIDITVPREIHPQVMRVMQEELKDTNIRFYGAYDSRLGDATFRMSHKNFPSLNLDIFYSYCFSEEAGGFAPIQKAWTDAHQNYVKKYNELRSNENEQSIADFRVETDKYFDSLIKGGVAFDDAKAKWMTGELHWHYFRLAKMDDLLPLGTIEFEGSMYPAPRHPEQFLSAEYGDVYSFPPRFDHHQSVFLDFDESELPPVVDDLNRIHEGLKKKYSGQ